MVREVRTCEWPAGIALPAIPDSFIYKMVEKEPSSSSGILLPFYGFSDKCKLNYFQLREVRKVDRGAYSPIRNSQWGAPASVCAAGYLGRNLIEVNFYVYHEYS
jgi:hypothetical protein